MFLWLVVVGGVAAFAMAFGIGANDAANAFATSVGAKALTYRQAVVAGSLMEFLGAALMGKAVTDTVRKGVVDSHVFDDAPELLMLSMFCAIVGAAVWLQICTRWGVPVSTTHSIIGGIVGAALAARGGRGVDWATIGLVVASWVISPLLSALASVLIYVSCRRFVLRRRDMARALALFPVLVFVTVLVNAFFIIYKGAPAFGLSDVGAGPAAGIAIGIAVFFAAAAQLVFGPILRRRVLAPADAPDTSTVDITAFASTEDVTQSTATPNDAEPSTGGSLCSIPLGETDDDTTPDLEAGAPAPEAGTSDGVAEPRVAGDARATQAHAKVERFLPEAERLFSGLQVVTAVLDSFAHGANDVANAIGPFAAMVAIYSSQTVSDEAPVPAWILILGGAGISLGLAVLGYRVIQTIGLRLVAVTPSRGFSIELGAAAVVVAASQLGIPVSTTHCQVGATVGVGLTEADRRAAVNWPLFVQVLGGWVLTLLFAGVCSAALFSFAAYSPAA